MKVFLTTLGCRLNEAEVETWSRQLENGGHQVVGAPESANVVVVNTCAVTSEAARKSRKYIGGLHRRNPEAKMVVTGCYAELDRARAASQVGVDLVIGNGQKDELVHVISRELDTGTMPVLASEPDAQPAFRAARTRAFVKVQDGCRNRCTFCIVTIARGDERSRSIDDVVGEIELLVQRGLQEAVLTGVHLGGYGADLGCDLRALVTAILERTAIRRLRLSSLEPWDLPADFGSLWSDARLMPHLHLPLQSGSDPVLRRMARRCPTGSYRRLVDDLRARIPDLVVTTDLIVGFPGETEAEWAETVAFVREMQFAHMHIFSYSTRAGTAAARMKGHVDEASKRARSREMHQIAAEMKRATLARYAGTVREVLWETEIDGAGAGRRRHAGYTDNYLRVFTDVPASSPSIENRVLPVRLALSESGELEGTLL